MLCKCFTIMACLVDTLRHHMNESGFEVRRQKKDVKLEMWPVNIDNQVFQKEVDQLSKTHLRVCMIQVRCMTVHYRSN